jgi:hypothetical protein
MYIDSVYHLAAFCVLEYVNINAKAILLYVI